YALDNPDQRIAVDINNFVTRTLDLSMALLANVGRLFAFSYVLWTVSGELPLPIAVGEITIPGYMIWVALIYAGFATWITHVAGRRLIPLKFDQQQVEADFRYHLARIREHSDSISMASGGPSERRDLMTEFALIRSNWLQLLKYERRVLGLSLGFGQLSQLFPYLAALPALIAGTIALGGVVQLGTAFGTVVGTLSWFARAYSQIADWKASVDRLTSLDRAMNAAEDDLYASEIDLVIGTQDTLSFSDLTLSTPTGRTLLEAQSFQISAGQNTLITGPSGSGKSTLFRAIAGQWVWGSGQVVVSSGKMFFIPQTPYLPKGSLRSVLAYPGNPDDFEKQYMSAVLQKCSLSHLTELLDETRDWGRSLSGGEKQLLCLARALIARPDWLFMDEVTSAMDPTSESNMLKMLFAELLNTTCVLIAHGKTKSSFFQTQIHLNDERKSLKVIGNSHPLIPEQSGRF
ncbi:MAG: SbmA/BacA-like family transporter, partial [Pseudomonadota bacterium]